MLLIIILAIAFVVLLATGILVDNFTDWFDGFGCKFGSACVAVALVLAIIPAIIVHMNKDGDIATNTQRYNSLVYQYENNLYDNDNDVGKKELMGEIQKWNENLARGRVMENNKWLSIYFPKELYDNFDFIEIN